MPDFGVICVFGVLCVLGPLFGDWLNFISGVTDDEDKNHF